MIGRLLAADPRARAAATAHRSAHLHHVFGRLAARHPEVAHQHVRHVRRQPVANCRRTTNLCVEPHVDLFARESLGHENIYQPSQSDFATCPIHNRNDFRTRRAYAADETCPLTAIDASHQEIDRLNMTKSRKKLEAAVRTKNSAGPLHFLGYYRLWMVASMKGARAKYRIDNSTRRD